MRPAVPYTFKIVNFYKKCSLWSQVRAIVVAGIIRSIIVCNGISTKSSPITTTTTTITITSTTPTIITVTHVRACNRSCTLLWLQHPTLDGRDVAVMWCTTGDCCDSVDDAAAVNNDHHIHCYNYNHTSKTEITSAVATVGAASTRWRSQQHSSTPVTR
jgi:hypothetical protein